MKEVEVIIIKNQDMTTRMKMDLKWSKMRKPKIKREVDIEAEVEVTTMKEVNQDHTEEAEEIEVIEVAIEAATEVVKEEPEPIELDQPPLEKGRNSLKENK